MMRIFSVPLAILSLVIAMNCSSAKAVKKTDAENKSVATQNDKKSDNLEPIKKEELTQDELAQVNKVMAELQDVPFDFDRYTIPTEGLEIIKQDVNILNAMLEKRGKYIRVTIEGHTDERGSEEYNLALGDRRAKTVKDYLINVGFAEKQLLIITYGKERPKVDEHTPEAWAANRRAHLTVE